MMFVWIDLAVVWINHERCVVDVRLARRWHLFYLPQQPAQFILEISGDRIGDFNVGDQVEFMDPLIS